MACGTILVVDNHPEIVEVTKAMLARSSYQVLTAHNGEDALECLHTRGHVDLVLSEILMPGVSGPELIGAVKQTYPGTAVMLMTGFTDQPIDATIPFIEKPFTVTTLIKRVEEVLAQGQKHSRRLRELHAHSRSTVADSRWLRSELVQAGSGIRENVARSPQARREDISWCTAIPGVPIVLVLLEAGHGREAACRLLSQKGFSVLKAADADEALILSQTSLRAVDMLVTDLLPGGDSRNLAGAMQSRSPNLRFVYATGDTELGELLSIILDTLCKH